MKYGGHKRRGGASVLVYLVRGVGIAHFNMATQGVGGGKTPEVRPLTAYVLLYYLKTKSI